MNIYLVCETCQYEGIQQIIKAFDSRPKAEKFIIDTEAFKARNKPKYQNIVKWLYILINNRISEMTGVPVPENIHEVEEVMVKYHYSIPYKDFSRIEQECLSSFTTEERKIFEFDFNNNKLEITEMEVE